MESLYYLRAQLLAASLTEYFNKFHYSYSEAGWEASCIFREKQFHHYGIYPQVYKVDDKIIVKAILSEVEE